MTYRVNMRFGMPKIEPPTKLDLLLASPAFQAFSMEISDPEYIERMKHELDWLKLDRALTAAEAALSEAIRTGTPEAWARSEAAQAEVRRLSEAVMPGIDRKIEAVLDALADAATEERDDED